jgi:hypothetical protein
MTKVYLLWRSYHQDELIPIGCLKLLENGTYAFKFIETALAAEAQGCFLPFPYTDGVIQFEKLPLFFEQRILKGDYNKKKFGLDKSSDNKMEFLVYGDSIKNSDNFQVISEDKFRERGLRK